MEESRRNQGSDNVRVDVLPINKQEAESFISQDVGICLPLGTMDSYKDKDVKTLSGIQSYMSQYPPMVTKIVAPNATLFQAQSLCVDVLERLISKQNVCYFSGWLFIEEYLPKFLPINYDGRLLKRGTDPDIPMLIEWNGRFEVHTKSGHSAINRIWDYGTWGYIVSEDNLRAFERYVAIEVPSEKEIHDFFKIVEAMFWVKGDFHEEIWVVSHKWDSEVIKEKIKDL